jgi:hypothetical protein
MIHVAKSKGEFIVASISDGRKPEKLSTTQRLSSKQKVWQNIRAHMRVWNSISVFFQDDTTIEPGVWYISKTERVFRPDIKPGKKYTPGKK